MRKYYARFFAEVRKNVFTFWKEQVVGGLVAGVITAAINGIGGIAPVKVALLSSFAVVCGYLALLGIAFICSVMCAPVNLDNARQKEILDAEAARNASEETARRLADENVELRKPRRSVGEQITFEKAKSELEQVGLPHRLQFIRTLIHSEKIEHNALVRRLEKEGLTNAQWSDAMDQFRRRPILVEPIGATPMDQHNYWRVNPHYRDALLELCL